MPRTSSLLDLFDLGEGRWLQNKRSHTHRHRTPLPAGQPVLNLDSRPSSLALQESPLQQLLSILELLPLAPSMLLVRAASSRGDGTGWPLVVSRGVTRLGPHH